MFRIRIRYIRDLLNSDPQGGCDPDPGSKKKKKRYRYLKKRLNCTVRKDFSKHIGIRNIKSFHKLFHDNFLYSHKPMLRSSFSNPFPFNTNGCRSYLFDTIRIQILTLNKYLRKKFYEVQIFFVMLYAQNFLI